MTRAVSASTRVAGVIGSPVGHSLSPALHNAAFESAGLDWTFVAFEVPPGGASRAVDAMKALGIAGLAVTMPHKADVAAIVDDVDEASAALHSVNTIVLRADGSTFGASTDGAGFVESLRSDGIELRGRRVVVLGAGGASRSIIDALGRCAVADIAIVNRTADSAASAARLAPMCRVGTPGDIPMADVVVNATSVGMGDMRVPFDPSLLDRHHVVVDIVYHPRRTALLEAASAVGAVTVDGLGMLVHQAAAQQRLWTGRQPDTDVMRAAADDELRGRS